MSSSCVSIPRVLPLWPMTSSTNDHRGGNPTEPRRPQSLRLAYGSATQQGPPGLGNFREQKRGDLRKRAHPRGELQIKAARFPARRRSRSSTSPSNAQSKQVIEHHGQLDFLHARATEWVALLAEAQRQGRLEDQLRRLELYPLLVCDEVGYIPCDPQAANLMFMLVCRRHERAILILTSNKPFRAWAKSSATTPPPQTPQPTRPPTDPRCGGSSLHLAYTSSRRNGGEISTGAQDQTSPALDHALCGRKSRPHALMRWNEPQAKTRL